VVEAHEAFMGMALQEADAAASEGETPIGAVVVCEGAVVARAHNRREIDADPTAHAELIAIREASRKLGRWRLTDCTVYVTLEPCPMCAGALVNARVGQLVYGATDPKAGAVGTLYDIASDERLNHRVDVIAGVRAEESARLLKDFFAELRVEAERADPAADAEKTVTDPATPEAR
jgi:tRNA(adenine34) deaminase